MTQGAPRLSIVITTVSGATHLDDSLAVPLAGRELSDSDGAVALAIASWFIASSLLVDKYPAAK